MSETNSRAEAALNSAPLLVGVIGALAAFVVAGRYGPGLSTDSAAYLSAADSIRHLAPLRNADGAPLTLFPPLFPLLIAVPGWVGVQGAAAARLLNAACFGAVAYASGTITARVTASRVVGGCAAVAVVCSAPMLDAATYVWSELPFVALLLLFTAVFGAAVARDDGRSLIVSALLAATLPMTRYAGVAAIPAALVVLLLAAGRPLRRLRRALLFGAVSSLPLALYLLRNLLVAGVVAGERAASARSLVSVVRSFVASSLELVLPWSWIARLEPVSDAPWALLLLLGAALFLAALISVGLVRWYRRTAHDPAARAVVAALALFFVGHSLLLCWSSWRIAFEPINVRYVVATFPVAVILIAVAVQEAATGALDRWSTERPAAAQRSSSATSDVRSGSSSLRTPVALVLFVLFMSLQALRAGTLGYDKLRDGAGGYATTAWVESPMVQYLRRAPIVGAAITNGPDVVFLVTGERIAWSPRVASAEEMGDLGRRIRAGGSIEVIWFDALEWRSYLRDLSDVLAQGTTEVIHQEPDGAVYRLSPTEGRSR
jgi:hypothetical protein